MTLEQRKRIDEWVDGHSTPPSAREVVRDLRDEYDAQSRRIAMAQDMLDRAKEREDAQSRRIAEQDTIIARYKADDPAVGILSEMNLVNRQVALIAELEERVKARPSINLRGEEVEAYEKRIAELQRALEEAEKDAARIGWIERNAGVCVWYQMRGERAQFWLTNGRHPLRNEIDAAIERALATAQPSEGSE